MITPYFFAMSAETFDLHRLVVHQSVQVTNY